MSEGRLLHGGGRMDRCGRGLGKRTAGSATKPAKRHWHLINSVGSCKHRKGSVLKQPSAQLACRFPLGCPPCPASSWVLAVSPNRQVSRAASVRASCTLRSCPSSQIWEPSCRTITSLKVCCPGGSATAAVHVSPSDQLSMGAAAAFQPPSSAQLPTTRRCSPKARRQSGTERDTRTGGLPLLPACATAASRRARAGRLLLLLNACGQMLNGKANWGPQSVAPTQNFGRSCTWHAGGAAQPAHLRGRCRCWRQRLRALPRRRHCTEGK